MTDTPTPEALAAWKKLRGNRPIFIKDRDGALALDVFAERRAAEAVEPWRSMLATQIGKTVAAEDKARRAAIMGAALIVEDEADRGGSLRGAAHRLGALADKPAAGKGEL